jgi:hypothetical protein
MMEMEDTMIEQFNRTMIMLVFFFLLSLAPAQAQLPAPIVVAGVGFLSPESVQHDPAADVYLVSNVNGSPLALDNNGFISRLAPDGSVLDLKWIEAGVNGVTLHGPKGLAIIGDILYVSDVDAIRLFDRVTGALLGEIPVSGTLLNDLCAGPSGALYLTDVGLGFTDAVYRIEQGAAFSIASGPDLGRPNGCAVIGANVFVVTFGSNQVYRTNPSGKRFPVATLPTGMLDGIVRVGGSFFVSSWAGSAVYKIGLSGGEVTTVLSGIPTPADIGYDAHRHRLLVPLFMANTVLIQPLD